jgi:hypothetical protein
MTLTPELIDNKEKIVNEGEKQQQLPKNQAPYEDDPIALSSSTPGFPTFHSRTSINHPTQLKQTELKPKKK